VVATDTESIGRMRDIAAVLAISQHVLLGDPDQLRAQIGGRIGGIGSVRPGRTKSIRLVPEEASLAAPGEARGITLAGHNGSVESVAASPDARRIASAGADRTIRVWDLKQGIAIAEIHVPDEMGRLKSIAVSADGALIAAVGGSHLGVWRWRTGLLEALWDTESGLLDVEWVTDDRLVTGANSGGVGVWSIGKRRAVLEIRGHKGPVRAVGVTPDGRRIVSASTDKTLKVWDAVNGSAIATFTGQWEQHSLDMAPDGRHVITGSDTVPLLWDLDGDADPAILTSFYGPEHDSMVNVVAFTMDGALVVSAAGSEMKLWRTDREYPSPSSGTWVGHLSSVTGIAPTPDGQWAASSSYDGTIKLWHLGTGGDGDVSTPSADPIEWLGFGSGGRVVGATVRYDDTDDGAEWESGLRWPGGSVRWYYRIYSIARSSDGRRVVVSVGNNIRVLDVASGVVREIGHQSGARLAVEPTGRRAISFGFQDESVRIWDLDQEADPTVVDTGGVQMASVAWSSDGAWIAAGLDDGAVRLWRPDALDTGRVVPVCDGPVAHLVSAGEDRFVAMDTDGTLYLVGPAGAAVLGDLPGGADVAVSPDHRRVAVVGRDEVAIWEIEDGRRLAGIPGERLRTTGVYQCGIRGNPLPTLSLAAGIPWAAACNEATVTVWDLESGEPLASFTADGVIEACSFDDHVTRLAVGTVAGETHILGIE